jgi:hypothetical protein
VRATFSGHAEFDLLLEARSATRGDIVFQAVLSLVLMNPKAKKGGGGGKKDAAAKEAPPPGDAVDTWALAGDAGRRYAAIDGDISPMHLYKATAMLMGFPAPVANVHFLAARTEASLAVKLGERDGWERCVERREGCVFGSAPGNTPPPLSPKDVPVHTTKNQPLQPYPKQNKRRGRRAAAAAGARGRVQKADLAAQQAQPRGGAGRPEL